MRCAVGFWAAACALAAVVKEAHEPVWPYSHATRGNVPVDFTVVGG